MAPGIPPGSLSTTLATIQTLTQAMPGSLHLIIEDLSAKLHDNLQKCLACLHEKWEALQAANTNINMALEVMQNSVLEHLNTLEDEFGTMMQMYKYKVDESLSWLYSALEEKITGQSREFKQQLEFLHDTIQRM